MTDNRTDWNGYPNEPTWDFDIWYSNHEPLYRAVNAYAADCLRRVPSMTDQTLGTNVKLVIRGWVHDIDEGKRPWNHGWGENPVSENMNQLVLNLRGMADDITRDHLHELSETDIGELVRDAITDESSDESTEG